MRHALMQWLYGRALRYPALSPSRRRRAWAIAAILFDADLPLVRRKWAAIRYST